jgi:copper resistance protein D
MNDSFLGILRLGLTALQYLAFAVLVGGLLSDRWLGRMPSDWQAKLSRRLSDLKVEQPLARFSIPLLGA